LRGQAGHLLSALGMGYVCHILRLAPLGMVMLSSLSQVPVNVQGSFSLSRRNSPDTCNLSQGDTCCHKVSPCDRILSQGDTLIHKATYAVTA